MKNNLFVLLLALIPILFYNYLIAGRCSGGAYCTACSNCSSCKNCSEEGGSCSVCANYDEPEPQAEVVPVPVVEPEPEPETNDDYDSNFSNETSKEEKSSYTWVWWTGGILGGLWLLGSVGKK